MKKKRLFMPIPFLAVICYLLVSSLVFAGGNIGGFLYGTVKKTSKSPRLTQRETDHVLQESG